MPAPRRPVNPPRGGGIRWLVMLLAWGAGQAAATQPAPDGRWMDRELRTRALGLINDARRDAGRPPVASLPELDLVAGRYAAVMATAGYVGHVAPDPALRTVGRRLAAAGIDDAEYGENVGRFGTSRDGATWTDLLTELSARLLASDVHRPRILDRNYTHAGTGVARGWAPADADPAVDVPALYLTQVFIARRADIRRVATRAEGTHVLVELAGALRVPGRPGLRLRRPGDEFRPVRLVADRDGFTASFRLPVAGGRARLELDAVDGGARRPGRRWIIDPLQADAAIRSALEEE